MSNSKHLKEFNDKMKDRIDNPEKSPLANDPRIQHMIERQGGTIPPDRFVLILMREMRRNHDPELLEAISAEIYNMWASQVYPED